MEPIFEDAVRSQARPRVLVVDDSPIVQERLAAMLAAVASIELIGRASDIGGAVRFIESERPDAVVLDLGLKDGSGLRVLERIKGLAHRPTIVVLTNYPFEEYRRRCLALGAAAFLDKSSEFDRVVGALLAAPSAEAPHAALPPVNLDYVLGWGPTVMFVLDVTGERPALSWAAPNLERLTGFDTRAAAASGFLRDRVHPDDLLAYDAALERVLVGEDAEVSYRFRHERGHWIWLHDELRVIRDDGRPTRIVGAMLNVSERERAKQELVDREARYRALAEATSDAIVLLEDGIVREISRPFTELFGYTAAEIVGRPALDFVAASSRAAASASIAEERQSTEELRLVCRDGSERIVAVTARMHTTNGRRLRLLALRDRTRRRQLENQVLQSQKMEAVGRLAGCMAHDFNNVLTAIRGCLVFAMEEIPDGHAARADLECSLAAVEQGAGLARQLLSLSRPQTDTVAPVDVNAVLEEDATLIRRLLGPRVSLERRLGEAVPKTRIEPTALRQVLLNLVMNARDALPSGGVVEIATAATDVDGLNGVPLSAGRYLRIRVRDSGIGMAPDVQARVFEAGYTTKPTGEGTGLGLASSSWIVAQAGGHIGVTSAPGEGATFDILLPAAD